MNTETLKDNVIVALDTPTLEGCEKLLDELKGVVTFYKIGFELFTAHGWKAVELVKKYNAKVFLDLKLHDIPNTVSKTASVICDHDVDMFNVHALGGLDMMAKTREVVDQKTSGKSQKPIVIAVTILTSHSQQNLTDELRIQHPVQDQVLHLAGLTQKAGLDGIVSSPQEVELVRGQLGHDFVVVTPGIRPEGSDKGDQKRTYTPQTAFQMGSSYIVVGRPITQADSPREAASAILSSL